MRNIISRWRSAIVARCFDAWCGWRKDSVLGKAMLLRHAFDLWRWYVAASRRQLVRQLRCVCQTTGWFVWCLRG